MQHHNSKEQNPSQPDEKSPSFLNKTFIDLPGLNSDSTQSVSKQKISSDNILTHNEALNLSNLSGDFLKELNLSKTLGDGDITPNKISQKDKSVQKILEISLLSGLEEDLGIQNHQLEIKFSKSRNEVGDCFNFSLDFSKSKVNQPKIQTRNEISRKIRVPKSSSTKNFQIFPQKSGFCEEGNLPHNSLNFAPNQILFSQKRVPRPVQSQNIWNLNFSQIQNPHHVARNDFHFNPRQEFLDLELFPRFFTLAQNFLKKITKQNLKNAILKITVERGLTPDSLQQKFNIPLDIFKSKSVSRLTLLTYLLQIFKRLHNVPI